MLASRDECEHSRGRVSVLGWRRGEKIPLQLPRNFCILKTSSQQASHVLKHIRFSRIYSFYDIWI